MKRLLTFTVLLLALSAGAQYPPPYVHNYWSTQAQAQVNSPIMNSSHEVTNFVNNGQTLSSIMIFGLGNLAAESGKVAINDDGSGNFANNLFKWTTGGAVSATSFAGDGSGLTNLPSSGGGGSVIWNTNAAGTLATNTFSKGNISFNLGGGFFASSFTGSGAGLSFVPDSALSTSVLFTNGASSVVNFATVRTTHIHGQGGTPTVTANTGTFGGSTTVTLDANASDVAGLVIFTPQNSAGGTFAWTNTFANAYSTAPHVVLTYYGTNAFVRSPIVWESTTTKFVAAFPPSESIIGANIYRISYIVIE